MKIKNPEVVDIVEESDSRELSWDKSLYSVPAPDSFIETDLAESVEIESSQILASTRPDWPDPYRDDSARTTNINIQNNVIVVAPWASSFPSFVDHFAVKTSGAIAPPRQEVLHTIELGRPRPKTYFRVHPDAAYCMDAMILEFTGEQYIVSKSIQEALAPELTEKRLYLWMTQDGNLGIWPINAPRSGDSKGWIDPYSRSALKAARIGMSAWISIRPNHRLKQYDVFQASWDIEPQWPLNDFGQLLMLAFEDRVLETMDDPIVKEVLGEVYYGRTK